MLDLSRDTVSLNELINNKSMPQFFFSKKTPNHKTGEGVLIINEFGSYSLPDPIVKFEKVF